MSLKSNQGINVITMVIILVGLIVGGFVAGDLYVTVHEVVKQSTSNGVFINKTISKLDKVLTGIPDTEKNILGNLTAHRIVANITRDDVKALIEETERSANASYANQEKFFKPYFNRSFTKIFKALNITD